MRNVYEFILLDKHTQAHILDQGFSNIASINKRKYIKTKKYILIKVFEARLYFSLIRTFSAELNYAQKGPSK